MDDFNNFFDDQRGTNPNTPIYHTPNPQQAPAPKRSNTTVIIAIVVAVLMTVIVIVNVVVLASLKTSISNEYADSIAAGMKEQYDKSIQDALDKSDIIQDITDAAADRVTDALNNSIGAVANEAAKSVAKLYIFTNNTVVTAANLGRADGVASGFLITDGDSENPQRYLVTNAHVERYVTKVSGGYDYASYKTHVAVFDDDSTIYKLQIVAYGGYEASYTENGHTTYVSAENDQPDLAVYKIIGTQPDNTVHPSLKIVASNAYVHRGDSVALVGNPQGFGDSISVSTGVVSQTGITIDSWGQNTEFVMTDAALNLGNSGGPMINTLGEVVGVVESKLYNEESAIENMGFAISVDTLRTFLSGYASSSRYNQLSQNIVFNLK